ncbi:MAG TPA: DUF2254 domain-containing protein [Mycobacteriales bacterium]
MTGAPGRTVRAALAPVRDSVRTQLWPVPMVGVVVAVAAGVGLPRLDARIDDRLPPSVTAYLFGGGAEAARAVLSSVAGSLITVTSLTFSLTVVTLQLASSQFSPRLLRTFTRDRFVHVTLALFLATFSYALTVLRVIRGSSDSDDEFVPQISVTVAFVLAIASVAGLVLFLAHLAREIRVETMVQKVHRDAEDALEDAVSGGDDADTAPEPPASARPVAAGSSGFLVRIDEAELLAAAVAAGAMVRVDRPPGSYLVAGTPLARTWPRTPGSETDPGLSERVAAAVTTGTERTQVQDVAFGLRQLTDVAVKALSPGINDPTTAVYALSHASALLCTLTGRDLAPRLLRDEDGVVRVVLHRPDFAELLELAVAQPRRYGVADPVVLGSLASLLSDVAWRARTPDQRGAVADQLARLRASAAAQDFDPAERAHLAAATAQVEHALAGRWDPAG